MCEVHNKKTGRRSRARPASVMSKELIFALIHGFWSLSYRGQSAAVYDEAEWLFSTLQSMSASTCASAGFCLYVSAPFHMGRMCPYVGRDNARIRPYWSGSLFLP